MNQLRPLAAALFLTLACSSTGCASILKGNTSTMHIGGVSPGDRVVTSDGREQEVRSYRTQVELPSNGDNADTVVVKTKRGDYNIRPTRFVGGGWIVADILLGGLIGVLVDGLTGNWHEYRDVTLAGRRPPAPSAESAPKAARPDVCAEARYYQGRAEATEDATARARLQEIAARKRGECQAGGRAAP
jgi:hypothetical protein